MALSRVMRSPAVATGGDIVDGIATFQALFAGSANPSALSNAFGAAGRKQYATVYHTAGSTKNLRVREVLVSVLSSTGAATVETDLVQLNSAQAPSGGTAITGAPMSPADAAHEASCQALPSTAGSEFNRIAKAVWQLGVTGAASTANPPPPGNWVTLYAATLDEQRPLLLRKGVAEGIAVVFDSSAASTVTGLVLVTFTEES